MAPTWMTKKPNKRFKPKWVKVKEQTHDLSKPKNPTIKNENLETKSTTLDFFPNLVKKKEGGRYLQMKKNLERYSEFRVFSGQVAKRGR